MHYYLVSVASAKYHGKEPLTYACEDAVPIGSIVHVPLQRASALGVVVGSLDTAPAFVTKQLQTFDLPPLPETSLKLLSWMQSYYPAPLGSITQLFLPNDLTERTLRTAHTAKTQSPNRDPKNYTPTDEQAAALEAISKPGSYLLHGETGSGKTAVYIELAKRAAAADKSSIILTPEISLTSQLFLNFATAFPEDQLFVIHSGLTVAQRRNIWLSLLQRSEPGIIIGPRSAVFSPLSQLGLIVVDESHETAYKQESTPFYHASRVASSLANIHNATVVFGSATPSVADYFVAQQKDRPILRMEQQALLGDKKTVTTTTVIDLRDRSQLTRNQHISTPLIGFIEKALNKKQQSLLFMNRRGTARIVLCDSCGWQALCPHCDLPLTYHHDNHDLRCHSCTFRIAAPSACPECRNTGITLKSIGTKSIAASIQKLFPNAKVARFDTDNSKGERLNETYDTVHAGDIDIIVGTQLLAKGLDLPKLSVVGIINADASLYLPDFTAQERTYQLLHQLIGRVGRGHQADSNVLIQTYTPDNPIIRAVASRNWPSFYESELLERKKYQFPPYYHLLKLSISRARLETTISAAEKQANTLRKSGLPIIVEGPAPAFHEKSERKFTWQLIIKAKSRAVLLQVIEQLPRDWSYDIDPINLL